MRYNTRISLNCRLTSYQEDAVIKGIRENYFPEEVINGMNETLPVLFMDYMKNVYEYVPEKNREVQDNRTDYFIDNDSENESEWISFRAPLFNLPFVRIRGGVPVMHSSDCPVPGLAETARLINEWNEKRTQLSNSLGSELKICGKLHKFIEKFPALRDTVMQFTGTEENENLPVMIDMDAIVVQE